ncbi:TrkH family potassium uptake protein [Thiospirochaeta perfilievii]|nr:potassium transporter TrkG [Thiospirochaeta perfilievii]
MRIIYLKERDILFLFFISIIIIGTTLLFFPIAWQSDKEYTFVDSLFTAVSAVCVTGLSTVDIVGMTLFGKIVLLILIQVGGLGLITFSSMFLALPRKKLTLANTKIIQNYFTNEKIVDPKYIIKIVLRLTLTIELIGAFFLFFSFKKFDIPDPIFSSIFHSVSAFCNAGFSTIPGGLEIFRNQAFGSVTFMLLIVTGGMGFVVLQDIFDFICKRDVVLLLHTKIMLVSTLILIFSGCLLFYIFEFDNITFEGLTWSEKILPALFQSITTRTAGFNTINQGDMTMPSKAISLGLMLIGGGSGSTAGGIKVTTAFLILGVLVQGLNADKGLTVFKRKISSINLTKAGIFFGKAIIIVFMSILGILIAESFYGSKFTFMEITFESFSAIATVGLSLGITSDLSVISKLIIIFTMFAGRIGLFSLIIPVNEIKIDRIINYPEGEVLIG